MSAPPPHPREAERLRLLETLALADTDPDPAFDDIVALACEVARAPIALISLVYGERQWFLASKGIEFRETPREDSLCGHAILADGPMCIPHASADPRFRGNPLVDKEGGIEFYIGVPIRVGDERLPMGALCVIRRAPAAVEPAVVHQLSILARMVERCLEHRYQQALLTREVEALAQAEGRFGDLVDKMGEGLVVHASDGAIVWSNPAASRLLGLTNAQLMGRSSFDPRWQSVRADGSPFPGEEHPAIVALRTGGEVRDVVMGVGVPEDRRWIRINAQPLAETSGVAVSFADITELIVARDRAQSADRAKSGFLATMSHELRTPINGVIGLTDVLLCGEGFSGEQRELLRAIRESGRSFQVLLDDILSWSSLESGELKLEVEVVDAVRVAREVVDVLAPLAKDKGLALALTVDEAFFVRGDSARVRQVLYNLVGNAVKFTERGRVDVTLRRGAGATGCFEVRDTGVGIPKERRGELFRRFSRLARSPGGRSGGVGLGLAISDGLARRMRGDIDLVSAVGVGSVFTLRLPLAEGEGRAACVEELRSEPATQASLRVLVAEDNPVNTMVITHMLEVLGHRWTAVEDGHLAVSAYERASFDVVLLDVHMPTMGGREAATQIRALEAAGGRVTPLIAVTASAMPEEIAACLAAGIDDVLTKPVTLASLRQMLSKWSPGSTTPARVEG
jgi:PAS domain S-box-containing protein